MYLTEVSIKRPVFTTMMMVALVVFGVVAYQRLAVDEYPDITYPIVMANTSYPGASPEVMERDVSRPIEEALNTVQGIREITSTSSEGNSSVRVMLQLGMDPLEAQQEVIAKIARIRRQLPPDIDDPVINRFDPNDRPIMAVAMTSSERPLRDLTDLAEQTIKPRFESVAGVGGVNVNGGTTRQIRVQLNADALVAYGISPAQVSQALARENTETPAGRVIRGESERMVRVTGKIRDPRAFADVVIAVRNGAPIRVRDVATVEDGVADRRSASFIGETPSVTLEVLKVTGSNTVAVSDGVKRVVEEVQRTLPPDINLTLIRDDSIKIRHSLADVQLSIILGAVLTILIIYLFLNSWRSTVITGLTLPVSIISAFFVMWLFDFTINTMTLLALSLAIGLLIDDAIVVRENIVRHIEMGKGHFEASLEGTKEIGLAVLSTTLAVVAVFIPVAFMGGQIGKIFFQFGVTVAFAVLVSLFVSFTLDPMLSSVWADPEVEHGGHEETRRRTRNPIRKFAFAFDAWFERTSERYKRGLDWALDRRWLMVGIATASVVGAFMLFPLLGFTWLPDYDSGEFNVSFRLPPGSRLEYTTGKGQEIQRFLAAQPEVEFTSLNIGGGGGFGGRGSSGGQIFVRLKPIGERDKSMFDIQTELRRKLAGIPGVRPTITGNMSIFGGMRQPIQIYVQGPEPTRLKLAAEQVLATMRTVEGSAEPQSSDDGEIPQLDVRVDRQQAWAAGLAMQTIGSTLQPLFQGQRATRWEDPNGYSHDVMVVYPDSERVSADDVAQIPLLSNNFDARTGMAATVPLAQVAEIRPG
ncbi:MAG: efflux RND transporter permease subunit, partial [Gemmatimonadetes bacterium]|nr:efflux RND transporter permease subunit [Gemmatimonadota bacterium]